MVLPFSCLLENPSFGFHKRKLFNKFLLIIKLSTGRHAPSEPDFANWQRLDDTLVHVAKQLAARVHCAQRPCKVCQLGVRLERGVYVFVGLWVLANGRKSDIKVGLPKWKLAKQVALDGHALRDAMLGLHRLWRPDDVGRVGFKRGFHHLFVASQSWHDVLEHAAPRSVLQSLDDKVLLT